MSRTALALASLGFLALGACNAQRSADPIAAAPQQAPVQQGAVLAEGSGCAAVIARYRAVTKSDADTGNANKSVYAQIDAEIRRAEAACAAGNDAEARSLIAASKARHGYPGGA
jgi:hypothetical protein